MWIEQDVKLSNLITIITNKKAIYYENEKFYSSFKPRYGFMCL